MMCDCIYKTSTTYRRHVDAPLAAGHASNIKRTSACCWLTVKIKCVCVWPSHGVMGFEERRETSCRDFSRNVKKKYFMLVHY